MSAASNGKNPGPDGAAGGRLDIGPPVAVIDIGSNSVRVVVYEGLTRSPTPIFNEKVLCGLGREVFSTGLLPEDAVAKALAALRRFRTLCTIMQVARIYAIATAACREAKNGRAFIREAEAICGCKIDVLSGAKEAKLSALGVASGIHDPAGLVGDLGGGSLELVSIRGDKLGTGVTLPLGSLALQDQSGKSVRDAEQIVQKALARMPVLRAGKSKTFYAVGGTWRALGRLHMWQCGYPLHVMHGYNVPASEAIEFAKLVHRVHHDMLSGIEVINAARRPLLAYAALVLEEVLRGSAAKNVMFSALGVREGLLFSLLKERASKEDPLLAAAMELNVLRSRSPQHGIELMAWVDAFMASSGLKENDEDRRLRHAACLLADIGWRAHPDYRGEQSLNIIAHAGFNGIDHPGRAFIALAVFFRHAGLGDDELSPRLRELASARLLDRARVLGAALRVAYLISAGRDGVLPHAPMLVEQRKLTLKLAPRYAELGGDRLFNRLRQLGKLIGREPLLAAL